MEVCILCLIPSEVFFQYPDKILVYHTSIMPASRKVKDLDMTGIESHVVKENHELRGYA